MECRSIVGANWISQAAARALLDRVIAKGERDRAAPVRAIVRRHCEHLRRPDGDLRRRPAPLLPHSRVRAALRVAEQAFGNVLKDRGGLRDTLLLLGSGQSRSATPEQLTRAAKPSLLVSAPAAAERSRGLPRANAALVERGSPVFREVQRSR